MQRYTAIGSRDGGGGCGMTVGEEQQKREHSEEHGGHVELRQHGLRIEKRVHQQEQNCQRRHGLDTAQPACEEIREGDGGSGEREHGRSRSHDRITGHPPDQRKITHHAGRMCIGNGGMRNPRPVPQNVQRGGDELAEFIPEIRQAEERKVREKNDERERGWKQEDGEAERPHYVVKRAQLMAPGLPGCGSSLISPNVPSYCEMFCVKTFNNALACCGLK